MLLMTHCNNNSESFHKGLHLIITCMESIVNQRIFTHKDSNGVPCAVNC